MGDIDIREVLEEQGVDTSRDRELDQEIRKQLDQMTQENYNKYFGKYCEEQQRYATTLCKILEIQSQLPGDLGASLNFVSIYGAYLRFIEFKEELLKTLRAIKTD